jgi:hypothetical protein
MLLSGRHVGLSLTLIFLLCAGIGTLLVVILLVGSLIGLGDHDVSVDHSVEHGGGGVFGFFSMRALAAAVGVFGLSGMIALRSGLGEFAAIGIGVVGGAIAMAGVGLLMRQLPKLADDGTVRVTSALGRVGTVYLAIPGGSAGQGKIQIELQGRTVELAAITPGEPLPTGRVVKVSKVISQQLVEVVAD